MCGFHRAPIFLRPVEDRDAPGLQRLLADAFADYPHCFLDVEFEDPGLLRPAAAFPWLQVLESAGVVVGSVGCCPATAPGGPAELKKLYVAHALRGQGWGRRLVSWVEAQARGQGAGAVELWTDTKFTAAHRVYERLGYRPSGRERALGDLSDTREWHYCKELVGPAAGGA